MNSSILIATPAYGGLLHSDYVKSIVTTCNELAFRDITHGLYILPDESLISRARNRCAAFALKHGFDKLLFIDADLGWTLQDIQALLESEKLLVGGTYPFKQLTPSRLSYNPLDDAILPQDVALRSYQELQYLKQNLADSKTGELSVQHIPTGFMLIDCSILKRLQEYLPSYQQEDTFSEYLTNLAKNTASDMLEKRASLPFGPYTPYLLSGERIPENLTIARTESLNEDATNFLENLTGDKSEFKFPHQNRTKHRHFSEYFSKIEEKIVYTMWKNTFDSGLYDRYQGLKL